MKKGDITLSRSLVLLIISVLISIPVIYFIFNLIGLYGKEKVDQLTENSFQNLYIEIEKVANEESVQQAKSGFTVNFAGDYYIHAFDSAGIIEECEYPACLCLCKDANCNEALSCYDLMKLPVKALNGKDDFNIEINKNKSRKFNINKKDGAIILD